MLKVGLTGGIASGKTAATRRFAELGAAVVDTDLVAREVVAQGTPGLDAVVAAFGAEILTPDGALDRAAMRRRVFADEGARRRLEAIVHPRIRQRTLELIDAAEAPYVIIAVPLLVETDFARLVDRIVVVDCPQALQIARLIARDGVTEAEARRALEAQTTREARLAVADDVIDNAGTLAELVEQVDRLHERYVDLGRDCPQS